MKVLVIRFSSIGDILLTSPVVRCLKRQVKDAEVHFLTKRAFRALVEHSPHIHRLHAIEDEVNEVIHALKHERFDLIVDLHHNLRTWRVKRALGVPARSFPKLNVEKWLMVNFKRDRLPRMHIVDRYMSTVEHLGVKNDGLGLELRIPPEKEVDLTALPESHRAGYTALAIGALHHTKRLPPHRLIELARSVRGPIVLIGGPDDRAVAAHITTEVGARVFDATGKHDLLGSASLIRQALGVIAHDSGAMHVAAAFQKNVVSIWGNTIPEFGMYPYMPLHPERAHIAQVKGLDCRPCSKLGFDQCPRGHFHCMEKQDLAWIAEQVR